MTFAKHLATASLALAAASTAAAGTAYFDVVNGQGHAGIEIAVTVQQSDLNGYDYEFVIENTTDCGDAVITGFYFEQGWTSFFSDSPFDRNLNLGGPPNFLEGGVTPGIAGWTSSMVSHEVMDQGSMNDTMAMGVSSGQSATLAFVTNSDNVSLADLEAALASQGTGIGLRLEGITGQDPHDAAWALAGTGGANNHQCGPILPPPPPGDNGQPTSAPTPSAALMGLALLGIAGKRRRRNI